MHILIIEDASRFAETLENSLKELSHTIKRAIDASRASGFLEEEEFDCLIVDMNMRTTGLVSEQTKKKQVMD